MLATAAPLGGAAHAQDINALKNLSIEQLANIEVTSVQRSAQKLSQAPAAVYVITSDQIRRSGATSLGEALRLAPNLEVARVNSQEYAVSARGFNSVNADDKLLVLVDGRTIFSPFFHNVIWNQHQIPLDDIERIEVISGPAGTQWGANAVNGVINIITKSSRDTQGGLLDLKAGNFDQNGFGHWGGKLGENGTYRVYALGFGRGDTRVRGTGTDPNDGWNGYRTGFRTDWALGADDLTVQGDLFENLFDSGGRSNGGNVLGHWTRKLSDTSSLEVLGYYDRSDQQPTAALRDNVDTFDLQAQHGFAIGKRQRVVWGAEQRVWSDAFMPINAAVIIPGNETLALTNLFAQDTITLTGSLKATIGTKLEYNTLSGLEPLPSLRLAWQASPDNLFWGAVSRAAATPSRLDRELVIPPIFGPSPQFTSETLTAFETGYRTQPTADTSLSLSLYYNEYDDIRTTSPTGGTPPLVFKNDLQGSTYGVELWGDVQLFPWWRLSAGADFQRKRLHVQPGGSDIAGVQTAAGIDPGHQLFLRSYFDLSHDLSLYVGLRQIGSLQLAGIPAYFEADLRLGWQVTPSLEVSVTGRNLVHAHHAEATTGFGTTDTIPRSVLIGLRRSF